MRATLAVLAFLAAVGPASAATFNVGGFAGNIPIIDVSGPIVEHDDERFALFANALQFGVVRLDSRGGQIGPAIAMGALIRDKRFATYVSPGHVCASACGLIWLGGEPRGKDESAMVGFHGAYAAVAGQNQETGPGNAVIGAYLNALHYDLNTVVYVTRALPDQMLWLTAETAKAVGIAYDTRGEVETSLWDKSAVVAAAAPTPAAPVAPVQPSIAPPMQLQTPIPLVDPAPLPPPPRLTRKPPPKPARLAEPSRTLEDDLTEFFFGAPPAAQRPIERRTSGAPPVE